MPHYIWQSNLLLIISAEKAEGRWGNATESSLLQVPGGRLYFLFLSFLCPEYHVLFPFRFAKALGVFWF